MDKIFLGDKLAALRICVSKCRRGSHPISEPSAALQVLTLKHPKGHFVRPHQHIPKKRVTRILQECLVVIRGKIRIELFDSKNRCAKGFFVNSGEAAVLFGAPHALRYLEDTEIIEVKNGPFIDDKKFL